MPHNVSVLQLLLIFLRYGSSERPNLETVTTGLTEYVSFTVVLLGRWRRIVVLLVRLHSEHASQNFAFESIASVWAQKKVYDVVESIN